MNIPQFPKETSEDLSEEAGWHIGDGSMNFYKNKGKLVGLYQLRGHIEDDREHYIKRIKPIFKELYGIDISLREMPSTRVFGFQIWSDEFVKFKQSLGLKIGPKIKIKIPSLFLSSDSLKIAVIRGIFDTDGCVYLERKNGKLYPRLEIKTISPILADQLVVIFNELGLRATKYLWSSSLNQNRKPAYTLAIRGVDMFERFMRVISPQNPKHIFKYKMFTQSFK